MARRLLCGAIMKRSLSLALLILALPACAPGFEVAEGDLPAFRDFLDELAYPYTPEADNPAYRFFLG